MPDEPDDASGRGAGGDGPGREPDAGGDTPRSESDGGGSGDAREPGSDGGGDRDVEDPAEKKARLERILREYRATLRNEADPAHEGFSADDYRTQKPPHW
ncbi:hypothetical protein DFO66_10485 [Brevibacterium sanguinis]|uniref:Uncharacterized protein n=2 Tax=Brevibacterium TaxID=1696 RepID=A0A366IM73_9MICO|nr:MULTISPECIES: hypothetical protein [Brevibacterium]RBP65502.1 hypothetical protein DFO66_10485 [Brevibacterium sanguinis]RBP72136.1 hypothetical protein DFO65_10491 [Brevibacterium celere]